MGKLGVAWVLHGSMGGVVVVGIINDDNQAHETVLCILVFSALWFLAFLVQF